MFFLTCGTAVTGGLCLVGFLFFALGGEVMSEGLFYLQECDAMEFCFRS